MNHPSPRIRCFLCGNEGSPRVIKGMPMRFCGRCDLLWLERPLLGDAYYERLPVRMEEERIQSRVRNARDRIRMMRRHVPLAHVCDIGAGEGTFLQVLRAQGHADAFGIEPGAQGVAEASARGVPVLQGGIRDLPVLLKGRTTRAAEGESPKANLAQGGPRHGRVFTMFHVIEHLDDPALDMRLLFDAMESGAFLVVETPDLHGYTPSRIGDLWKLFYPEHRTLFSRRSLKALLEQTGFRVIAQGRRDFDPSRIPLSDALFRLGLRRPCHPEIKKRVMVSPSNHDTPPKCASFDRAQHDTLLRSSLRVPLSIFLSALVRMLRRYDYQWIIVRKA